LLAAIALPTTAAPTRPAPTPQPQPNGLACAVVVVEAMLPVTASAARAAAAILVLIDMRNSIRFERGTVVVRMPSWTEPIRIRFDGAPEGPDGRIL